MRFEIGPKLGMSIRPLETHVILDGPKTKTRQIVSSVILETHVILDGPKTKTRQIVSSVILETHVILDGPKTPKEKEIMKTEPCDPYCFKQF